MIALWERLKRAVGSTGRFAAKAAASVWQWLRDVPPERYEQFGRIALNLLAIVGGLQLLNWLLYSPGEHAVAHPYDIVAVAAGVSTIVTAFIVLAVKAPKEQQRGARHPNSGAGRFWLICFALVATVAFLSDLLDRVPRPVSPSWFNFLLMKSIACPPPDQRIAAPASDVSNGKGPNACR